MNKFNVRISAIGGILLLVSIAFALAQHDSRRRTRILEEAAQVPAQPAEPIEFETAAPDWHQAPPKPLVRANDDDHDDDHGAIEAAPFPPNMDVGLAQDDLSNLQLPSSEVLDNPLRESVNAHSVVTASGQEPAGAPKPASNNMAPPTLPAGPPSWLNETLPQTASQAPPPSSAPATSITSLNSTIPPLPSSTQLPSTATGATNAATKPASTPSVPTFPINANSQPLNSQANAVLPGVPAMAPGLLPAAEALGALPNPQSAAATGANNFNAANNYPPQNYPPHNDMSDTQRGAMAPTSLTQPQAAAARQPVQNYAQANAQANTPAYSPANTAASPNNFSTSQIATAGNNGGRTPAALTSLVSNEPGSRYLDGSQNPIMLIQKRGPEEVRVGRPATFVITVRNAGNSTAHDVIVDDSIPLGMRFNEANPPVNPTAEGLLRWKLGEMPPGDERTINLQMIPERQGELGSVASVHFAAQASLRTVATQPKLEIQIDAQQESLVGDAQLIAVTVKNVGTGVARGVRLEADLPAQLRHESGDQHLEAIFPNDLAPNQSQRIELRSMAAQPGDSAAIIRALTEDGAEAQQQVPITVLSPALIAAIEGPRLRYLDRQATYKFKVQNNGTATATNLKFVVRLPSGLRFNSSDNNNADYNPADHTVTLGLHELPVGVPAMFELTVLPVERGTQVLTLNASADLGISTEAKGQVAVEGLAELAFTIGQDNGTIEVGSSSTYTVQVTNVGNNPDKDVRLAVQLPAGAQVLKVDAPVRYRAEGNQIQFEPIPEMRNKDQYTYRFEVRHTQPGSLIVRTQLTSTNWPVAVVKEEGTLVYNDQN